MEPYTESENCHVSVTVSKTLLQLYTVFGFWSHTSHDMSIVVSRQTCGIWHVHSTIPQETEHETTVFIMFMH